ncbi:MAG: FkbM family methyltransferase [Nitratireductor sp.]|nr:FkbM family methyltransferase [Nitratireductor sp.]
MKKLLVSTLTNSGLFLISVAIRLSGDGKLLARILQKVLVTTSKVKFRLGSAMKFTVIGADDGSRGIQVSDGNIVLLAAGTRRYFSGGNYRFQGEELEDRLRRLGRTRIDTFLDIGANCGELAIWFAQPRFHCRVAAVEPVRETLELLRANIALQSFPTDNITVFACAVTGTNGSIRITSGHGSQNSVVARKWRSSTETVESVSLATLLERCRFDAVSFLKIDIEGAEPMLADDLAKALPALDVAMIEFSDKNAISEYLKIVDAFTTPSGEWRVRTNSNFDVELDIPAFRSLYAQGRIPADDVWFYRNAA